jgi:hypothetical protein
MKARDLWFPGYRTETTVTYTGATSVVVDQASVSRLEKCIPGAIVHGNFHDPNAWSYTIWEQRNWVGSHKVEAWSYVHIGGGVYVMRKNWTKTTTGDYGQGDGPENGLPAYDQDLLYNIALNRLNERVRGELDLGVGLAEAGQTIRMIRALSRVRDYSRSSGFGSGRDLANGWLQWQYGWRPLMTDVFGAANEALNIVLKTLKKCTGSANLPLTPKTNQSRYIFNQARKVICKGSGKASCRIVCVIELPGATLDRWSTLNPIGLGWELVPYSFIVDWFFDVGSFLRNAETALLYSARFVSGYVSELYAWDGQETAPYKTYRTGVWDNYNDHFYDEARASIRYRKFKRSKLLTYPFPRAPSFRCDLGSQQLLSLAAILRQLL